LVAGRNVRHGPVASAREARLGAGTEVRIGGSTDFFVEVVENAHSALTVLESVQ
jgi:hypothetical protein